MYWNFFQLVGINVCKHQDQGGFVSWWSEEAFHKRVRERAKKLRRPMAQVLRDAELGHDTMLRTPKSRSIDALERLAKALDWTLADILGFAPQPINLRLSGIAWDAAKQVVAQLPDPAQSDDLLVAAHAFIYEALSETPPGQNPSAETVQACIRTLVRAFNRGRGLPTRETE